MKKFVARILLFCILVLFGLGLAEYYTEQNAYKSNVYAFLKHDFDILKDSIETVYIGTSLFRIGIDKNSLPPKSYVLAVMGQNLTHEYYIADRIIPEMPALKAVILELSYFTLRDDRDFERREKLQGCSGPTIYFKTTRFSRFSKNGWEIFNASSFRDVLLADSSYESSPIRNEKEVLNEQELSEKFKESALNGMPTHTNDGAYFEFNLKHFEGIVKLAADRGAQIYIVIPPTTTECREMCDPVQLSEMYSVAVDMQVRYGARIIDFFEDRRFKRRDFLDFMHLNDGKGAEKFTKYLLYDMEADTARTILHK